MTEPPCPAPKRLTSLDALRLLAASVVLLQHLQLMFGLPLPRWLLKGPLDAAGAVMLFFVLSGYVLAGSLSSEAPGWRSYIRFGIRRVLRIYPLYWVALLLGFAVLAGLRSRAHFVQPPEMPVHFLDADGWQWSQWLLQTTLVLPATDANFAIPPVWTLMTEARVAVVFPLLAWALLRLPLPLAGALLGGLILGSRWLEAHLPGNTGLLGQFGLGILLFRMPASVWLRMPAAGWQALAVVSLLLFSAISWRHQLLGKWPSYYLCAFGATGLVACAAFWPSWRRPLEKLQERLGVDLSYGLYILHYPIFLGLRQWHHEQSPPLWAVLILAVTATAALARVLHTTVELPAISLGRRLCRLRWLNRDRQADGHGSRSRNDPDSP